MIKLVFKPKVFRNCYFAPIRYVAKDWCFWPVLVFNEKDPAGWCRLLSLQFLNQGIGIAWQIGRSK